MVESCLLSRQARRPRDSCNSFPTNIHNSVKVWCQNIQTIPNHERGERWGSWQQRRTTCGAGSRGISRSDTDLNYSFSEFQKSDYQMWSWATAQLENFTYNNKVIIRLLCWVFLGRFKDAPCSSNLWHLEGRLRKNKRIFNTVQHRAKVRWQGCWK